MIGKGAIEVEMATARWPFHSGMWKKFARCIRAFERCRKAVFLPHHSKLRLIERSFLGGRTTIRRCVVEFIERRFQRFARFLRIVGRVPALEQLHRYALPQLRNIEMATWVATSVF